MPFSSLGLDAQLIRAIAARHYLAPTPIQAAAIPATLRGADVRVCAPTGSGKTAAFVLPVLQQMLGEQRQTPRRIHALILVPTRELAAQIGASLCTYSRYLSSPIKILSVFGGVSINPQLMALRAGADIVVATPGRLLDLVDHNALTLSTVATLVLDEADKLLELGFAEELARILGLLPRQRQSVLVSATFPAAVEALAETLLRDPVRIEVPSTPATESAIVQRAIEVDEKRRTQLLRHLIEEQCWTRVLVFVATKYSTEHVAEKLRRGGINAAPFHGELSQGARTQTLADFKAAKLRVVVATDVAARGIDIAHLPVVVNYDLPRSAVDYIHRIGRTGRAGESGSAVSFVTASSKAHFRLIEKRHHLSLAYEQVVGFEPVEIPEPVPQAIASTGGIKGNRKSKKDKLREAAARAGNAQPAKPIASEIRKSPWPSRRS